MHQEHHTVHWHRRPTKYQTHVSARGARSFHIELRQQAGDNVLFVINPGPCRTISHSNIWNVTEEEMHKLGKAWDYHRVGDCEIYFYNA